MNRFKKMIVLLIAICFTFSLSACTNSKAEYESTQGFEFHFYPEEYEDEYNEISKSLSLYADTDYQFKIEAVCQSGTMKISILYNDENEKVYIVNADAPCNDSLSIPANTTSEITITVFIEPDTKGTVIGDLLTRMESSGLRITK